MSHDRTNGAARAAGVAVETAAITDRGLSDKRPVNEDSFLADAERGIFAVADGVGGAQSGEVASQTAIETLDTAFRGHLPGDDAEDLMEIAFQRANSAINQMSRQRHRLAMMATTIVALHLDGSRATIGHVGDSRLYRLTPGGELRRETDDHSVVEEEVRAGRMSELEAQNHPSKNIISRALGAEANVEADTSLLDVTPGTIFLLCSDGITRHIPDEELRELLTTETDLHRVCAELKRRCYERGAEDNLTAVLVRIGARAGGDGRRESAADRTIAAARSKAYATGNLRAAFAEFDGRQPANGASRADARPIDERAVEMDATAAPRAASTGASRIEVSTESLADQKAAGSIATRRGSLSRFALPLALSLLAVAGGAWAFMRYGGFDPFRTRSDVAPADVLVPADPTPEPMAQTGAPTYAERRAAVDEAPHLMANKMWQDAGGDPLASPDPETTYLYARALLGAGRDREAQQALLRATERLRRSSASAGSAPIAPRLSEAEAALRSTDVASLRRASKMIDEMIERSQTQESVAPQPSPETGR